MPLEAWAQNLDNIAFTAFCWPKKVIRPAQIQGLDKQTISFKKELETCEYREG